MKARSPLCVWLALLTAAPLRAATNSEDADDLLVLSPPHPDLPPTFWEQYGGWLVVGGFAVLALAGFATWWLLRPKPAVELPPEVAARQELEVLRQRAEDGKTLSQISRVVRRYVTAAFALPPEELTTAEFCQALARNEKIGDELAAAVGEFLRRCDELKFAPSSSPLPMGAAAQALELVELGEARRSQLREIATAAAAGQPAQRA